MGAADRENEFEKTKPISSFSVLGAADGENEFEKTKPISSFSVLGAADCENEFEKTKPIQTSQDELKCFYNKGLHKIDPIGGHKKQTQFEPNLRTR